MAVVRSTGSVFSPLQVGRKRAALGSVALFLLSGMGSSALAESIWDLSASLEASTTYTDNVLLEMIDPQSDVLFSVDASAAATAQTSRSSVFFSYDIGYDLYANENDLNGFRQGLLTSNSFTLADSLLFLDLRASIRERDSQQSLQSPTTVRTINSGRRTTQYTALIHPYIRTPLGNFALLNLGTQYAVTKYGDPDVGGAGPLDADQIWSGNFQLRNLGQGNLLSWQVHAQASVDDDDFQSETYGGVLYVATGSSFRLLGRIGYDRTEGRRNGLDIAEFSWRGGFEYNPSTETSLQVEGGERYGGPSYSASLRRELTRNLNLSLSYNETLVTDQQRFVTDLNGVILGQDGTLETVSPIDADITGAATINKTVRLSLRGEVGRTNFQLSGFQMTREYDQFSSPGVLAEDEVVGVELSIDREFGRRTRAGLGLSYRDNDSLILTSAIEAFEAHVFGSYTLGTSVALEAEYSYQQREDGLGVNVEENVFMLSISKSW